MRLAHLSVILARLEISSDINARGRDTHAHRLNFVGTPPHSLRTFSFLIANPIRILPRMWRVLFFISFLPIAAALIARWWFGMRVLAETGERACRCDLATWLPVPGDTAVIHRDEGTAADFGNQLRIKALADWRERDPKSAAARESSRRFGMAVPPLSAMVAVMAVIVAKIPVFGALAIVLGATALAAVLGILTMPAELAAITHSAKKLREAKSFPRRDDEEAVVRCAVAHTWKEALPPILGLLQR